MKTYDFDKDKFKAVLRDKTGLTPKAAALKLGFDGSFFYKDRLNGIKMPEAMLIEHVLGIKPEEYAPAPKAAPALAPEPEPPAVKEVNTGMTIADRISLDKASKAIEDLRITINMLKNQIETLTEVLARMTEHMAHFDALFGDPMKLYRSIFIPMYNGIRACENDKEAERERKIDGTPKFGR